MKPISLKDLNPMGASFQLRSTGKEYRMRPLNLSDERWLQETFGTGIEDVFAKVKMLPIARIAFHQLEEEDKRDFAQQEVTLMNEEGVSVSVKKGGAELLFWLISGMDEKIEILKSLMQTIGISRAMIEGEIADSLKGTEEKKSQGQPTGQLSSIDLAQSMAGQRNTSGAGRSGKSRGGSTRSIKGTSTGTVSKRRSTTKSSQSRKK